MTLKFAKIAMKEHTVAYRSPSVLA